LSDAVQDNEMITIVNWVSEYELKPDKISLTEASSKKYLEDLLTVVKRQMERKRTYSSTSSSSASSVGGPKDSSTPRQAKMKPSTSLTRDMEYVFMQLKENYHISNFDT